MVNGKWQMEIRALHLFHFPFSIFHLSLVLAVGPALAADTTQPTISATGGLANTPSRITVAADGSGDYKTVQDAVDAVRVSMPPTTIHIKPGTYKGTIRVPNNKPLLTFEGEDAKTTILTGGLGAKMKDSGGKELGTFRTATVYLDADDFTAKNLTFENTAGPVGQALALSISGDRVMLKNCRLLGWQDTLYVARGRQYFADCFIEGNTDFIFGAGTSVFDHCEIHCTPKASFITAASTPADRVFGFVFVRCAVTGDSKDTYLGRPWRPHAATTFIDCELGANINPKGWDNWRNPENEKTARYAEYKSTGPGANPDARVAWSKQLTADEAAKYTPENIFAGPGAWSPSK
jgi:pectinesterase